MARRKAEPVVIYGARVENLAELIAHIDGMKSRLERAGCVPVKVGFDAYVAIFSDEHGLYLSVDEER